MAKLYLITLWLAVLVVAHATARNIPTDDQTTNPSLNALPPTQDTQNMATTAGQPATNGAVADQKNFISYGGVGGWGGVGGYVGVLPVIGGIGVGGVGGVGGAGGLGGVGGGLGGLGGVGLGKVGGIGVGGGVGGVGGIIP